MKSDRDLISWKSDAWKSPEMVSWYSRRMAETAGTDRLKNKLEVDLCAAHVVGPRVLDVGIGTGRASLPLAEQGYSVTGLDSSEAMLDETRRLAGGTPVDLVLGDLKDLPVDDGSFDSLLSLNCLMHFPHWRDVLTEWVRVVRPGGRLVFDIHSLDHFRITHGRSAGEDAMKKSGFDGYYLLVACRDLVTEATARGLAVVDIVPYGAFDVQEYDRPVLAIENKHWWRRLLSWMATDDRLFELAVFLEHELVARLTTAATGRYMAVLERRDDPQHNEAWLLDKDELNIRLAAEITLETLSPSLRGSATEFKSRLNDHVRASLRSFRFFEGLCRGLALSGAQIDVASFLEQDTLHRFDDWSARRELDEVVTAQARDWMIATGADEILRCRGVSLAETLEYFLVEDLLTQYHGHFSGVRS